MYIHTFDLAYLKLADIGRTSRASAALGRCLCSARGAPSRETRSYIHIYKYVLTCIYIYIYIYILTLILSIIA